MLPLAPSSALNPQDVTWSRLTFGASKFLLTALTEVRLEPISQADLGRDLMVAPDNAGVAPPPDPLRISLESSFAGRRSLSQVLFDPHQGTALQRFKHRFGGKAYQKTQRYLKHGVYSLRRSPTNATEAKADPDQWTQVGGTYYNPPEGLGPCVVITDPAVLLYWISAIELTDGFKMKTCTFSQKTFVEVEIEVEGQTQIQVDYSERSQGKMRKREGSIEVWRVLMRPLAGRSSEQDVFEFLGLEGDVVLFVDAQNRLPVQVSGRIPHLGGIDVKLAQVDLR